LIKLIAINRKALTREPVMFAGKSSIEFLKRGLNIGWGVSVKQPGPENNSYRNKFFRRQKKIKKHLTRLKWYAILYL